MVLLDGSTQQRRPITASAGSDSGLTSCQHHMDGYCDRVALLKTAKRGADGLIEVGTQGCADRLEHRVEQCADLLLVLPQLRERSGPDPRKRKVPLFHSAKTSSMKRGLKRTRSRKVEHPASPVWDGCVRYEPQDCADSALKERLLKRTPGQESGSPATFENPKRFAKCWVGVIKEHYPEATSDAIKAGTREGQVVNICLYEPEPCRKSEVLRFLLCRD